jgi:hypothetical protein
MKRSSSSPELIYTVLGTAFVVLGALTLLNIAAAWQVGGVILWGAAAYAGMDFLIAYGLFEREWWIPYAFALNLTGLAVMFGANVYLNGIESVNPYFYASALGLNALLAAFLYQTCAKRPRKSQLGNSAGAAFVVLWTVMFCLNAVGNFS